MDRQGHSNEAGHCSPLSRHDDSLAHTILAHGRVGILSNGEQMWLQLASPTTTICLNDLGAIERDALEGIDSDEDDSTVGIDAMLGIAIANGMQN